MNGREREPGAKEIEARAVAEVPQKEEPERNRRAVTFPEDSPWRSEYAYNAGTKWLRQDRKQYAKEVQRSKEAYEDRAADEMNRALTCLSLGESCAEHLDRALQWHWYAKMAGKFLAKLAVGNGPKYDVEVMKETRALGDTNPEAAAFATQMLDVFQKSVAKVVLKEEREKHPEHQVYADDLKRETVRVTLPMSRLLAEECSDVFEKAARTEWTSAEYRSASRTEWTLTLKGHVLHPVVNSVSGTINGQPFTGMIVGGGGGSAGPPFCGVIATGSPKVKA